MAKFVKLAGSTDYFLWDEERFRLYNYNHGWRDIDENSSEWINATVIEAEDWHDLYVKTGWTHLCFEHDYKHQNLWVDPDGYCWDGDAHEVIAQDILEVIYGIDAHECKIHDCAGVLERMGWIKLSTFMFTMYCEENLYDNITYEQARAVKEWCEYYDLPFSWVCNTDL